MKRVVGIKKRSIQCGYILVIALVLMVVMAFGALAAIRMSGMDSSTNNNTRSQAQAWQAAESAIAYCRAQVLGDNSVMTILDDAGDEGFAWMDATVWADSNKYNVVNTTEVFTSLQTDIDTEVPSPICLVENVTKFTKDNSGVDQQVVAYKITARGYSPNYRVDNSGTQVSGSQVWLQVVVARMLG